MVRYHYMNTYICDCCGKERSFCYSDDKKDCDNPKEEHYTDILITYPTGNKDDRRFDSHGITLCPECAKFVLDYLKENCNDSANWPEDL